MVGMIYLPIGEPHYLLLHVLNSDMCPGWEKVQRSLALLFVIHVLHSQMRNRLLSILIQGM